MTHKSAEIETRLFFFFFPNCLYSCCRRLSGALSFHVTPKKKKKPQARVFASKIPVPLRRALEAEGTTLETLEPLSGRTFPPPKKKTKKRNVDVARETETKLLSSVEKKPEKQTDKQK